MKFGAPGLEFAGEKLRAAVTETPVGVAIAGNGNHYVARLHATRSELIDEPRVEGTFLLFWTGPTEYGYDDRPLASLDTQAGVLDNEMCRRM